MKSPTLSILLDCGREVANGPLRRQKTGENGGETGGNGRKWGKTGENGGNRTGDGRKWGGTKHRQGRSLCNVEIGVGLTRKASSMVMWLHGFGSIMLEED